MFSQVSQVTTYGLKHLENKERGNKQTKKHKKLLQYFFPLINERELF